MKPAIVAGVGLWTPGYPTARAWVDGRNDPAATRPVCTMLNSRIGRYTSQVTRMAIEALQQAAAPSALDLREVQSIFGSAYGEIRTAFDQLDMIASEGVPSPARFKNSVHNTASGHVSIATGNMGFSTSLAAGSATLAMCLLEAFAWLDRHGGSLIVVVADEPLPDHLALVGRYDSLGIAFLLCTTTPGAGRFGRLSNLRRDRDRKSETAIPPHLIRNPCAGGLALVSALATKRSGPVAVEIGGEGWCVDFQADGGMRV